MVPVTTPIFRWEPVLFHAIDPRATWPRSELPRQPDTDAENARYFASLDDLIARLAREVTGFAELSRLCAGAWPGLVADRLTKLELWPALTREWTSVSIPTYSPELHCGFGEWYFTAQTADLLAKEFLSSNGHSLLLGTPTIAQ
jgi:hypothetical protein